MNRLEALPHDLTSMNRREAIATLGAAAAAPKIFSERQTARMNMARTMEGVPEIEGPAFQSMDQWMDASAAKIAAEFLPRMQEISQALDNQRTWADFPAITEALHNLAHPIAERMAGRSSPVMERIFAQPQKYGISPRFTHALRRILELVSRDRTFRMPGGKVRADLAAHCIQQLTRLPFKMKNNATLDVLTHQDFVIPDREPVWKSLARFCNQLNVQIDPAPFGYKDEFRNGKPESIEIADAGPLWRMTYSHTDQGMKYDGEVVRHENGTRWIFAPENSPPGVSRVLRGSYYPDKILVKHPQFDQVNTKIFSDDLLPFYDRKTDQVLVRCPDTARLYFRKPTEAERRGSMHELQWEKWNFDLPLQRWALGQQ